MIDFRSLGPADKFIFLSYESEDKPLVDAIADILRQAEGNVWTEDMIDNHVEAKYVSSIGMTFPIYPHVFVFSFSASRMP